MATSISTCSLHSSTNAPCAQPGQRSGCNRGNPESETTMTLQQALEQLCQPVRRRDYPHSLATMQALLRALGEPQRSLTAVTITGSSGKSSICHQLATLLQAQGLRNGCYLSPHMHSFRERFLLDGAIIGVGDFCAGAAIVAEAADSLARPGQQLRAQYRAGVVVVSSTGRAGRRARNRPRRPLRRGQRIGQLSGALHRHRGRTYGPAGRRPCRRGLAQGRDHAAWRPGHQRAAGTGSAQNPAGRGGAGQRAVTLHGRAAGRSCPRKPDRARPGNGNAGHDCAKGRATAWQAGGCGHARGPAPADRWRSHRHGRPAVAHNYRRSAQDGRRWLRAAGRRFPGRQGRSGLAAGLRRPALPHHAHPRARPPGGRAAASAGAVPAAAGAVHARTGAGARAAGGTSD